MPVVNPGVRRVLLSLKQRYEIIPCASSITTPVDETLTIPAGEVQCSTGAIEIDSVAAGDGIVVINGFWRLT